MPRRLHGRRDLARAVRQGRAGGVAVQYLPSSYWSTFAPGLVQGATYKGQIYGAPLFEDQGFLYYRKDLLAKEHLPVPTTWQQLESEAVKIKDAGLTKYGYVWQGDSYEGLTCNFMEYLGLRGQRPQLGHDERDAQHPGRADGGDVHARAGHVRRLPGRDHHVPGGAGDVGVRDRPGRVPPQLGLRLELLPDEVLPVHRGR